MVSFPADGTAAQTLQQQQKDEIARLVAKIQRASPIMVKLGNGRDCEIESDLITHMQDGGRYSPMDWTKLCNLFVAARAPAMVVSVGVVATLPTLKHGETGFWIREVPIEAGKPQPFSLPSQQWCFTVYKPSSNIVTTYAVKQASCERCDLSAVASTAGSLSHMLSTVFHQETGDKDIKHTPFQDAILFDMLLEFATGEFTPHQRRIEDGLAIQLEILQALEQLQIEAESAATIQPSKRRRTIKERLALPDVKQEP